MSRAEEARPRPRSYKVPELMWLASQYFVKSYLHLKWLRETREPQHAEMAKACSHRAAQMYLLAAAQFQGHQMPSPVGELPQVEALVSLLNERLRFEAEAALRAAAVAPADTYWRDVAQGLRARFERAEPALFTDTHTATPAPDEEAPLPCPRGGGRACPWRS